MRALFLAVLLFCSCNAVADWRNCDPDVLFADRFDMSNQINDGFFSKWSLSGATYTLDDWNNTQIVQPVFLSPDRGLRVTTSLSNSWQVQQGKIAAPDLHGELTCLAIKVDEVGGDEIIVTVETDVSHSFTITTAGVHTFLADFLASSPGTDLAVTIVGNSSVSTNFDSQIEWVKLSILPRNGVIF